MNAFGKVKFIGIGLLVLSISAAFVVFYTLKKERMASSESDARYLCRAISAYAKDMRAKGGAEVFPDTLDDLVRFNYLTLSELNEFNRKVKIEYNKPKSRNQDAEVVLRISSEDGLLSYTVRDVLKF